MNIIAIIPTHDRPEKFFKSFDSVSQSLSADKIIVVHEDSDEYHYQLEKTNM